MATEADNMAEPMQVENTGNDGQTSTSKTKTQESIEAKGDKSYYYWHKYVSNTVPITPPTVISKEIVELPQEKVYKKITNYMWMDDEKNVKVYVEYVKIGDASIAADFAKEKAVIDFTSNGFDLRVHDYRGDHQLKVSLKDEIDPENSSWKPLSSKLLITLRKKDESKTWYDLIKKN